MSPIGRVFIVLNLVLAAGFAWVSGTYLQKQDNYKQQLARAQTASAEEIKTLKVQIGRLEQERNTFENAKTTNETQLLATRNELAQTNDENKRLHTQVAELDGSFKKLLSIAEAGNTEMKAAFEQAKAAYAMATADQKARDDAVRAKDAAEAENRTLKTTIASLEESVKTKDADLAKRDKELSEANLLVSVAQTKGFLPAMAAPTLAGMVTSANGRLCTIQITDNPGNVDIAEQIAKRPFGFAIWDASTGYKGEAIATKYEPSANAVLCNISVLAKDAVVIKEGDKASTRTN
jgi:hypothetical protein